MGRRLLTFHGLHVRDFPNCFVESIAQSGFTVNFPYLLDVHARDAAWVATVMERSALVAERRKACTPGYYNREGRVDDRTQQGSFFIGGPTEYADILTAWRDDGTFDGLEFRCEEPADEQTA